MSTSLGAAEEDIAQGSLVTYRAVTRNMRNTLSRSTQYVLGLGRVFHEVWIQRECVVCVCVVCVRV
jgi:hypothetical protein